MKKLLTALLLVAITASCKKLTKQDASQALSLYYSDNPYVECTADIDIIVGPDAFACDDGDCRRCANALLDAKSTFKTEKSDIYRYVTVRAWT